MNTKPLIKNFIHCTLLFFSINIFGVSNSVAQTFNFDTLGTTIVQTTWLDTLGKIPITPIMPRIDTLPCRSNVHYFINNDEIALVDSLHIPDSIHVGNEYFSWNWQFGDGDSATGHTVKHHYRKQGNYTVTLTKNWLVTIGYSSCSKKSSLVIQTASVDGLNSNDSGFNSQLLYPNPAHDMVKLNRKECHEESNITLYNFDGLPVKRVKIIPAAASFSISDISQGLYFYTIDFSNGKSLRGKLEIK